jgi:polysaccharide chain length determinant protein (PEP-CTERM system associated)
MMQIPFEQFLRVLWYEAFRYRWLLVAGFLLINAVAIAAGLWWPPSYVSSTTILVEQKNIIQPLMKGTAVAGDIQDQAKIAREIIFSRKVMTKTLQHIGLLQQGQSNVEQERIIDAGKDRTKILNVGPNLIRIEYHDRKPERAYEATRTFAELFIAESLNTQAKESQAAYDFIDSQVQEYHDKLTHAEQALKEFRSANVDARPGTSAEVSKRVGGLEDEIEKTSLELKEARIQEESIEKQLSGEASITVSLTRESQYTERIVDLQSQLETLRLTYHDTYPDIVRIKHQIEDLKEALAKVRKKREEARKAAKEGHRVLVDENIRVNPIYQRLKQQLFETRTKIQTLNTRLADAQGRLKTERNRAARVSAGEALLAELTRDYEVNRDIYQDLLRRRENARVSRNLDRDKQQLTLRVQEPAILPVEPSGLRLLYVVLAGGVLSIAIPLGILLGAIQFDPRIRLETVISKRLKLPVMTVVPQLWSPKRRRSLRHQLQWIVGMGTIGVAALGVFGILRMMEVL